MKKLLSTLFLLNTVLFSLFAQFDDDLFFTDDTIEEVSSVKAVSDLQQGILFENGSVKIGGSLSSSLTTQTLLLSKNESSFSEKLSNTTLTPELSSLISIDARPTQDLRIYTKFALSYPFTTPVLSVKECFTDFSIADQAFFRFGLHTVSWGTGFFYSPVSDIINTSSIDPENTDKQVNGSLNLRAQITFKDSLNTLWLYAVPPLPENPILPATANKTALAAKYEFVLGGWEFGTGAYYKFESSPKGMITASGSLKKMSFFAEAVYQYGAQKEWEESTKWSDKSNIFYATAGFSYFWKEPSITLAAQYYYDGNSIDNTEIPTGNTPPTIILPNQTKGHNVAAMANFGKIGNAQDLSISLFSMLNFGKDDPNAASQMFFDTMGVALPKAIFSANLNYNVNSTLSFSAGPYVSVTSWSEKPDVSLKLTAKLGGGKY